MPIRCTPARGLRLAAAAMALALIGAAPAAAATVRVTIEKLGYNPAEATAHVGDTIEWVNNDFIAHTATAKAQGWDVMIPAKKSATLVVKQAGTVDYICTFTSPLAGEVESPREAGDPGEG
jgi:plastocyanin